MMCNTFDWKYFFSRYWCLNHILLLLLLLSYLCDLITPYSNSCNLRSNNQLLLASCQPRTKLKTYGERSFQYAAPNEWNN